jgi:hypothetical protein
MTTDDIDAIMAWQSELIAALDAQDAAAIISASEALAAAVAAGRNNAVGRPEAGLADHISAALQQNKAAAMRTNSLLHWTRQRIGKINELRGVPVGGASLTY